MRSATSGVELPAGERVADLAGQGDVFFGDAARGVRHQCECHSAPTDVDIRVVVVPVGKFGNRPHRLDSVKKRREGHRPSQSSSGMFPPVEIRHRRGDLVVIQHSHEGNGIPSGSMSAQLQVVVAGALIRDGAVLLAQRQRPPELAGLWELPGGKVAPGETESSALERELREELGVDVRVGRRLGEDVPLSGSRILRAYQVTQTGGDLHNHDHGALRWVSAGELSAVDWVPADRVWLPALTAALVRPLSG